MKSLLLLAAITLTVGCGAIKQPVDNPPPPRATPTPVATPSPTPVQNPATFTADELLPFSIGDVWNFTSFCNNATQTTKITFEAAPDNAAGTVGPHVIMHFTKSDPCAYWGVNIAGAEDHFLLWKISEGWRGVADIPDFPQGCNFCLNHTSETINWHAIPGMPTPYLIVPATITEGQVLDYNTEYNWWQLWDVNTTDDISNPVTPANQGTQIGNVNWRTTFTVETINWNNQNVKAVKVHQEEGTNIEDWYFVAGIGLVRIIPTSVDPTRVINRVL